PPLPSSSDRSTPAAWATTTLASAPRRCSPRAASSPGSLLASSGLALAQAQEPSVGCSAGGRQRRRPSNVGDLFLTLLGVDRALQLGLGHPGPALDATFARLVAQLRVGSSL